MRWSTGFSLLFVLAAGCSLLASCEKVDKKLDTSELEEAIAEGFEKRHRFALDSVTCPHDVAKSAGSTFECTAREGPQP